ncbi:MAG TPA: porin family protein [Parasegetibacter sp.]
MKKTLVSIFLICCYFAVNSQDLTWGIKGGLNLTGGRVEANNRKYSGSDIGVHAGVLAKTRLSETLDFEPHLFLSFKRAKVEDVGGLKVRLITLDLPLNVVYRKDKFFGGLGPNLSFGLSGNYIYNKDKYDVYDKDNTGRFGIKHLEIGLNLIAGYQIMDGLFISANYTRGLNNLFSHSRYASDETKVYTSVFGISIGKMLKK